MGCEKGYYEMNDCVIETVRKIDSAQRKAADDSARGCSTSCEQSIEDLLSPAHTRPTNYTTIPFMLFCKGDCDPFVGSGFVRRGGGSGHFKFIESPVFKVRGFVRGSSSCVRLELLIPVSGSGSRTLDAETDEKSDFSSMTRTYDSFHKTFGQSRIHNFRETGLCITVDLKCFCGISCLDPITPVRR